MHSDDRWLSAGERERRHVSKADPWLDGLGLDLGLNVNVLPSSLFLPNPEFDCGCVESVKQFSPLTSYKRYVSGELVHQPLLNGMRGDDTIMACA